MSRGPATAAMRRAAAHHAAARPGALARVALAVAAGAALAASPARAAEAPADSLLRVYLRRLADSTDAYFGASGARPDTTGLDSTLAARLADPRSTPRAPLRPGWGPWFGFNRVDGPVYGAALGVGRRYAEGRVQAGAGYAAGPNEWRGSATYEKRLRRGPAAWGLDLTYERETQSMDRDARDLRLAVLRALLTGADTRHYLLREGFEARLGREHPAWGASATFRALDESPLDVTARWNLTGAALSVPFNLAAAKGTTHELEYAANARLGRLPFQAEVTHVTSSRAIGSDFEFRRTRVALAGDIGATRWLALVPQLEYGRLTGEMTPQAAFYLGGSRSLRAVKGFTYGGTGAALARLDAILLPDVLWLARIPHPDALPLQLAAFGAIGAIWGRDPYGGPPRIEETFPEHADWLPEAGASLLYRPGLPDPSGFMRLSWAYALGPGRGGARFTVSYSRGVDLVRPLGGE